MNANGYDFDLACIGSGPAGQRAAVQAAKLGKRVAVVERRRIVGGVCVDTGTIPSKTFREAVLSAVRPIFGSWERNFDESPPPVTATQLVERIHRVVHREAEVVERQLRHNNVALLRGHARFEGPHTLQIQSGETSQVLTADKILIACGSRPAPATEVPLGDVVLTSEDILNLRELPHVLAVVGGGVIGVEYASMFAALGINVILTDRRARPLEFLDHEIGDELMHQMRGANVTFRLEETVAGIEVLSSPKPHAVLTLESGKKILADMVLYSIGRVGATDNLNLRAVSLETQERGRLQVDDRFQTMVPDIFAAGDVIGYPSLAATSSEQGRLAVCFAFGVDAQPMAPHFPVGIYSIPEISMVGATEHELTSQRVPYEVGVARYSEIARGQILGDDSGLFKMLFHRETRKLLGVHAIGTNATELIHIGQAVMGLGGGLDYFLHTVFNYPTLAECYKVAALNAANKLSV